jgi:hypothetical protein
MPVSDREKGVRLENTRKLRSYQLTAWANIAPNMDTTASKFASG